MPKLSDNDIKYLAAYESDSEDLEFEPEFPECEGPSPKTDDRELWWPGLYPTQMEAFEDYTKYLLLSGERGCMEPDTIVYTDDGLARLSSLKPEGAKSGEFTDVDLGVSSFDGQNYTKERCKAFWVEKEKDARRVTFENGSEVVTSARHPIWVNWLKDGKSGFGWAKASEISEGLKQGIKYWTPHVSHPSFEKKEYQVWRDVTIDERAGYLVGALIGDGCLGTKNNTGFTNPDHEVVERVREYAFDLFGAELKRTADPRNYQYTLLKGRKLREFLKEFGQNHTSYYKFIPDIIVNSPKSVVSECLSGLFDADGTAEKTGNVSFTTTSKRLSKDVQFLLGALGIMAPRRFKKSVSKKPTWNVYCMGENAAKFRDVVGFKIIRKQERIKNPRFVNKNKYGFPPTICHKLTEIFDAAPKIQRRSHIKPKKRIGARKTSWAVNAVNCFTGTQITFTEDSQAAALERLEPYNRMVDKWMDKNYRTREWHDENKGLTNFRREETPSRDKLERIIDAYESKDGFENLREELKPYLISNEWMSVDSVEECESELYDLSVPTTQSFLAANLINHNSGKSIVALHKCVRHAWENWDALVMVTSLTLTAATAGGVWTDLSNFVLPEWEENIGMEWIGPRFDQAKNAYIKVANRYGGWSTIMLKAIPSGSIISQRFKGTTPSLIFFDELTETDDVRYFRQIVQQIGRRRHIKHQQFIAACNPSPQGEDHWVYKQWFVPPEDEKDLPYWEKNYKVYHIPFHENVKMENRDEYLASLKDLAKDDPTEYARIVEGRWVKQQLGEGIFKDFFLPNIHVKGNIAKNRRLLPQPNMPIVLGGDMGDVNNGFSFLQQVHMKDKVVWMQLDELEIVGRKLSIPQLTHFLLEKMNRLVQLGAEAKGMDISQAIQAFRFEFIADSSTMRFRQAGGDIERDLVKKASQEILDEHASKYPFVTQPIFFKPAPKGDGSVAFRVKMLIEMLQTERYVVDSSCVRTIDMFKQITSANKEGGSPFEPGKKSPYKHILDALTYPVVYHVVRGDSKPTTEKLKPMYY